MPRDGAIELEGTVIEQLREFVFRAELANGHRLVAYVPKEVAAPADPILPGKKVMLEVFPYDLSRGRITFRQQ